ncbi:MAG: DinB family protein [Chloroflexota bacterium]
MDSIVIFGQIRRNLAGLMKSFTEEQMLFIPDGFDNNIAWNFGHIVYVQESLTYRHTGSPTLTTEAHKATFDKGTSPADWTSAPDLAEVRELLKATGKKLGSDYESGMFTNFQPYTTSTGFSVSNIEQALTFVNFHEGLHLGTILAIRNLL